MKSSQAISESSSDTASASTERLHALDSLRAMAMFLGIVLHATLAYTALPVLWAVHDVSQSRGFDFMIGFIHGFRMQTFFFIAGFFGHLLWQRDGWRGCLAQRWQRIGIPFVVGMLTIVPIVILLYVQAYSRTDLGQSGEMPVAKSIWEYPTTHLWFLEILLFLYPAAALIAWSGKAVSGPKLLPQIDAMFDHFIQHPLKPLLLIPPTVVLLWGGPILGEIDTNGVLLLPAGRAVVYYGLFFAVGWWLHRRLHMLHVLQRWLKLHFLVATLAFLTLGACYDMKLTPADPSFATVKAIGLIAAATYAWTMTFAFTGLFLRVASRHRQWVRYLADASYWCYLWHLPLVIFLHMQLAPWQANAWLKFLLVLIITMLILLPSYQWLVRYTWVGRTLNGVRVRAGGGKPVSDAEKKKPATLPTASASGAAASHPDS
jgi:hypothetical protein